jgi:hypothetical protein
MVIRLEKRQLLHYSESNPKSLLKANNIVVPFWSIQVVSLIHPMLNPLNPHKKSGGPGGLGTKFIDTLGEGLQQLLGYEYDIIGFDPRGQGPISRAIKHFLHLFRHW